MDIYVVFFIYIQQHFTGYITVRSVVKVVETTIEQLDQVIRENYELVHGGVMYELFSRSDDIFKGIDKVDHK